MEIDKNDIQVVFKVLDKVIEILSKLTPELINAVKGLISEIAELLGLKGKNDTSEELGLKSEIAEKDFSEFDSREDYLNYLTKDVKLDDMEKEKLKDENLKEKYAAKGLNIEMDAINEKMGANLGLEDYVIMVKAGINKVQDVMTIIDTFKEKGVEPLINEAIERIIPMKDGAVVIETLKEGVNKLADAKQVWDKFNDIIENF